MDWKTKIKYDTFPNENDNAEHDTQMIHDAFNKCLLDNTPLTSYVCDIIISYLPIQYQFLRFHPFTYDHKYSIIAFILIMTNNLLHYSLITFMIVYNKIDSSASIFIPSIVFIFFCIVESCIILYTYRVYYKRSIYHEYTDNNNYKLSLTEKAEYVSIKFRNKIEGSSQLIHIPMTIIMLFFKIDACFMAIYFTSYLIISIYQCCLYRQKIIKKISESSITIFPLIYVQLNALLVMVYAIIYSSFIYFAISTLIIHIGFCLFLYFAKPGSFQERSYGYFSSKGNYIYGPLFYFVLICVESVAYTLFVWNLFNEYTSVNNMVFKISSLTFVIFDIVIISIGYYFYYDPSKHYSRFSILRKDHKFYLYLNLFHDMLVEIPMITLLFYYFYILQANPDYSLSYYHWYLAVIIVVLREFYKTIWIYRKHSESDYSLDCCGGWFGVCLMQLVFVWTRYGCITPGFVLFGGHDADDGFISIFFIAIGGLIQLLFFGMYVWASAMRACMRNPYRY